MDIDNSIDCLAYGVSTPKRKITLMELIESIWLFSGVFIFPFICMIGFHYRIDILFIPFLLIEAIFAIYCCIVG